jgi:hypothetical protein
MFPLAPFTMFKTSTVLASILSALGAGRATLSKVDARDRARSEPTYRWEILRAPARYLIRGGSWFTAVFAHRVEAPAEGRTPMAVWILSLMQLLVPHAPYADTFPATAAAIEKVAHEAPLYDDDDGVVRTVAELVALSFHESHFDPRAVDKGGTSFGLTQVDASNLGMLGLKSTSDLFDPETNLRAALKLMRISHRLCRQRPIEDALANYASGGGTCSVPEGLVASRRRMKLAAALLRQHPPRWVEVSP